MSLFQDTASFADQAIDEIEDEIGEAENKLEMWQGILKEKPPKRLADHAKKKIKDLKKQLPTLSQELKIYQELRKWTGMCDQCGGDGKMRVQIDQDESKLEKCNQCDGKGKTPA